MVHKEGLECINDINSKTQLPCNHMTAPVKDTVRNLPNGYYGHYPVGNYPPNYPFGPPINHFTHYC